MKQELIVKDAVVNFADCVPQYKEFMLDAFNKIAAHENIDSVDPEDFRVQYASAEPTNNFGGAFVTSIFGSYLIYDMQFQEKVCDEDDATECTILFYSLSKLSDDAK
jgi:hypothetical protein